MMTFVTRADEPLKHCPGAGEQAAHEMPVSMFSSDKSRVDGLAPYCRTCAATKQREWKRANPEKVRQARRERRLSARLEQLTL